MTEPEIGPVTTGAGSMTIGTGPGVGYTESGIGSMIDVC
jgi:hypothetical protein